MPFQNSMYEMRADGTTLTGNKTAKKELTNEESSEYRKQKRQIKSKREQQGCR